MSNDPLQDPANAEPATPEALFYFVDEAGDPTLFDAKGRTLVGHPGCSTTFILGKLEVEDLPQLTHALSELRAHLLADPYFKNVPSFQPAEGKTALCFHAKDDLPEVRREVFKLLLAHQLRFYAVVRDKRDLASYVQQRNFADSGYRYRPNDLYDELATRLFSKFHGIAHRFHICFAKRGTKDRTKRLEDAIRKANDLFASNFGFMNPGESHVVCGTPLLHPGLQAADYLLWTVQRFYEKQEDRFLELMSPKIVEIHDLDFIHKGRRGVLYRRENPLHLAGRIKKSGI